MKFAIFCKSFRDDVARFVELATSVERYNRDRLPFYASVPRADLALFRDALGSRRVELLTDEEILGRQLRQSWRSQQLVKLHVWRTGFADAWFWLDSDSYFIRDFTLGDFVRADGSVALPASRRLHMLERGWDATVAYLEDANTTPPLALDELGRPAAPRVGPLPRLHRWLDAVRRPSPEARIPRIPAFFGRTGCELFYLPATIWTRESLRSFEAEVLGATGATFVDVLRYAPWEAHWIGEWEIARGLPGRHLIESPLLHVRSDVAIRRARSEGLTEARVAARYFGLQLAARHQQDHRLDGPLR